MLDGYEEAELVAARIAASKMGFIKTDSGDGYTGDDLAPDGSVITEPEPGTFEQVSKDFELVEWNPQHPGQNSAGFLKHTLRAIATGLGVSYNRLANDLEGVNFSSMRHGHQQDRDTWQELQDELREALHNVVFSNWLRSALLNQKIIVAGSPIPAARFDKFNKPVWQGRVWPYVDPVKEVQAIEREIALKIKSRRQAVAERGGDIEEIFAEIKADNELAKTYNINLTEEKGASDAKPSAADSNADED
jgi:lambda family phage portal protein